MQACDFSTFTFAYRHVGPHTPVLDLCPAWILEWWATLMTQFARFSTRYQEGQDQPEEKKTFNKHWPPFWPSPGRACWWQGGSPPQKALHWGPRGSELKILIRLSNAMAKENKRLGLAANLNTSWGRATSWSSVLSNQQANKTNQQKQDILKRENDNMRWRTETLQIYKTNIYNKMIMKKKWKWRWRWWW